MHSFFREMLEFYDLAPHQLTPNSYHMAACMYILYDKEFSVPLTARELEYFYRLKDAGKNVGHFYLSAWEANRGKCIKGNKVGMNDWLDQFLYCYDCKEYIKDFNTAPSIPKQTILDGVELRRAKKI